MSLPGSFRVTVLFMCDTCGDVIRVTGWVQLTLDASHEMWFKVSECLCGVVDSDVEVRETVTTGG